MSDRAEAARDAFYQARWEQKKPLDPIRFGVEWADANPQPRTITPDTFQGLIDYCNKFRDKRAASDDQHARTDAYAWGFVETAVGEYLWDLGIEVEDDE